MSDPLLDMTKKGGIIRARNYDNIRYELTIKKALPSKNGKKSIETNIDIDKDMFDNFLAVAPMSHKKTRYKIEANGGLWDVDALWFADKDALIPWLKIDHETTSNLTGTPNFPMSLSAWFEVHTPGGLKKNTKEQEELLAYLFNGLCLKHNPTGLDVLKGVDTKGKKVDINDINRFV